MRSNALRDFLVEDHGITMTHNRPSVSNDNPFSESEFVTGQVLGRRRGGLDLIRVG